MLWQWNHILSKTTSCRKKGKPGKCLDLPTHCCQTPFPTESCRFWRLSCQMRKRWDCTIRNWCTLSNLKISSSSSSSSVLPGWLLYNLAIRHFSMRRIKAETSSQLSALLQKTNRPLFPTASQLWNWSAAIEKPETPRVRSWSDVSHCNPLSLF